jgi:hypothetical protein
VRVVRAAERAAAGSNGSGVAVIGELIGSAAGPDTEHGQYSPMRS